MKVLLVSAALALALCAAAPAAPTNTPAAPAAPEGWRPSGRLILLPAHLEAPTETSQASDDSKSNIFDRGEYYVLLEDGRLQMVKYTTAALTDKADDKDVAEAKADAKADDKSAKQQAATPFAQFQVEYFQFPGQAQPQPQPQPQSAQQKDQPQRDFEANLQYRDVKPISAPIYAYNSAPLVRILKK